MSKLLAVQPDEVEPKKPKILIYGLPNVGKTWASLEFPNVYYIDTEGGATQPQYQKKLKSAKGVYMGVEQGSLDFDIVIGQVKALATEKHSFKTLIIDSISRLYYSDVLDEQDRLGDKDSFGASSRRAKSNIKKLINWIDKIDMNVILIAHQKDKWGQGKNGMPEVVGTAFDCYEKLEYELDLILNIIMQGPDRKAKIVKTRLEAFPAADAFSWSYKEFAKRYGKQVIEKQGKAIKLASEEQLEELQSLFQGGAMIPAEFEDKVFKKYQIDSWDDMPFDAMAAALKFINENFTKKEIEE